MARKDWFRKTSWTDEDKEDFFSHLARSRGKGQHLRIQAVHLEDTHPLVALELLDIVLRDYRDRISLAQVHHQKAMCLINLSRYPEAVESFRESFEAERIFPNSKTQAYLDFGMFVAKHMIRSLYGEAQKILDEFGQPDQRVFPIQDYWFNAALALMASDLRQTERARYHAIAALQAAARTHSGFRYHAKLGLVEKQEWSVETKLRLIAGKDEAQ